MKFLQQDLVLSLKLKVLHNGPIMTLSTTIHEKQAKLASPCHSQLVNVHLMST